MLIYETLGQAASYINLEVQRPPLEDYVPVGKGATAHEAMSGERVWVKTCLSTVLGEIIMLHQPEIRWFGGYSQHKPPFGVCSRSFEVAITSPQPANKLCGVGPYEVKLQLQHT